MSSSTHLMTRFLLKFSGCVKFDSPKTKVLSLKYFGFLYLFPIHGWITTFDDHILISPSGISVITLILSPALCED